MRDGCRARSFARMSLTATKPNRTPPRRTAAVAVGLSRLTKLALALSIAAAGLAGTAIGLQSQEHDVGERILFTHNASASDAIDAKEIRADCPRGSMVIGGGAAIQHGEQTPTVALYQGFPVDGGWEVQAHETRPERNPRRPWTLEAIAVCLRN
jgi:hypothetical protein